MHCQPTGPSPPTTLPALSPLHSLSLVLPLLFFLICNFFFFRAEQAGSQVLGLPILLFLLTPFWPSIFYSRRRKWLRAPAKVSPPSTGTAFITAGAAGGHKPQHSWSPSCSEHQPAAPFLFSQPKAQLEGHQSSAEASALGSNLLPEPAENTRWVQVAPGGF